MYIVGIELLLSELSIKAEEKLAIVGAGKQGRELFTQLKSRGVAVKIFLDNDETLHGHTIDGITVERVQNMGEGWGYIVAIGNSSIRDDLEKQLLRDKVSEKSIIKFSLVKDYEYYRNVYLNGQCKVELDKVYYKEFSRKLNWDNPSRYTEILNVEKLNKQDPLRTKLADKVEVRKWVKEKIGEKYLIKRYYEWDRVEDIDFEKLPEKFVLKLNNGSGRNIIVKNKKKLDIGETVQTLTEWFTQNYAFCNGCYEFQYKDIKPQIVCEEYLEGVAETVYDYNIYCFHGSPKYIWCIKGSHRPECQASFYDIEWNMQPFSFGYPKDPVPAPKPEKLEEMLEMSAILCKGFDHVRVDWYNLPDGRVLFGEMTFTSWSGLKKFEPDEYDEYFGRLILEKSV